MEALTELCQAANAANLSLLLAHHYPSELQDLDSRLCLLEGQLSSLRAQLQAEEAMLAEAKVNTLLIMALGFGIEGAE